jgi:trk system potassium uptake protein TrkH
MNSGSHTPLLFILGIMLCGLSAMMLLPAIADASASNPDWQAFVGSASITLFVAMGLLLTSGSDKPFTLDVRHAFLLTAGIWIALCVFSALPFLLFNRDLGFANAVFESVSGLTTTGSTIMVNLDAMPPGILLWRSMLQWVGGIGIIVTAMMMLPLLRVGGMQLFRTESSDRSDKVVPRAAQLAAYIAIVYGALTVACAVAYLLGGMSPFDAVNHAMTTVSTGGYSTHDASFGFFEETSMDMIGTVFMILGGLPFVIYIRAIKGDPAALWRESQVQAFLAFLVVAIVIVAVGLHVQNDEGFLRALRRAAFNIISIVTTTGYANEDYTAWGPFAIACFLLFTFIGGCTGSTAGGIKIYRFEVLWLICLQQLQGLTSPNSVQPLSYNGRRLPGEVLSSVLAFLFVYGASVILLTVALAAFGLDLVTALSGAATALGNVGPGLGPVIGPAGNFYSLPDGAKLLLAAGMLLGRLELFTILVLFQRSFWKW